MIQRRIFAKRFRLTVLEILRISCIYIVSEHRQQRLQGAGLDSSQISEKYSLQKLKQFFLKIGEEASCRSQ